jgi:probable HAF family extracellular repeat protein
MVGMGDLPGGAFGSHAVAASADGSVVVGVSTSNGDQAFRWEDGVMVGLGDLPGGRSFSLANSVSADGSVVVGGSSSGRGLEAFRWDAGSLRGLGDLRGGGFLSWANDVSADGRVVVGVSGSSRGDEAFRWEAGSMRGLGDLAGGRFASEAIAVTGDGALVVGVSETDRGMEAFLWTETTGMRSLYTVLAEVGAEPVGWRLGASEVSGDGLHLAGMGIDPGGNPQAWVAYVPEPPQGLGACVALMLVGLSGRSRERLVRRRARSRRGSPAASHS